MNIYTGNIYDSFIVDADRYKGFKYIIISLGTHPCCYIEIPPDNYLYHQSYENINVSCHGGLTYSEKYVKPLDNTNSWYLGWDYAHAGDCIYYKEVICHNGKFWTLKEINGEARSVIDQIIENDPSRRKSNEITWDT